jgi:type IV fimbrial biogenesis protein FimT
MVVLKRESGFTVIELLIALAIAALVLTLALPNMGSFIEKRRLIGAAEAVYGQLQYARSEAISRSKDVYARISANGSTTWDMGVSTTDNCDPTITSSTTANACTLVVDDGDGNIHGEDPDGDGTPISDTADLVLKTLHSTAFPNVTMSTNQTQITFDPVRGTAGNGTITLQYGSKYELRVITSLIGRVRMCSPSGGTNVEGYPAC